MWGMLANIAGQAYNAWQSKKANDEAMDNYNRRNNINRRLAAEQLAITYNSIMNKSMEVGAAYKRKAFQLRVEERQAEGKGNVMAAQAGVAGRRAELARQMAVNGGTARAMTDLEIDAQREQDALIDRADMEERAMINRLISNTPDAPADTSMSTALGLIRGVTGAYTQYKDDQAGLQAQIATGGSYGGASTGPGRLGGK